MDNINLDNFSVDELDKLKNNIDLAIVNKRQSELIALRSQIDDLVNNSPFTLDEIMSARPMRKPVQPKYQNPDNHNETWTGRGRRPKWVESCIDNGLNLDDLEIR